CIHIRCWRLRRQCRRRRRQVSIFIGSLVMFLLKRSCFVFFGQPPKNLGPYYSA
ncbi:unnamed protein product, partial [Brassica rapa]